MKYSFIIKSRFRKSHVANEFVPHSTEASELSLPKLLDQYYSSFGENASLNNSSCIFYFLEYLDSFSDTDLASNKLRYWLQSEGYRFLPLTLDA